MGITGVSGTGQVRKGTPMDTGTVDQVAVERAYRTLAASICDFDFYRFISARTSGDHEWLEAA